MLICLKKHKGCDRRYRPAFEKTFVNFCDVDHTSGARGQLILSSRKEELTMGNFIVAFLVTLAFGATITIASVAHISLL